MNPRAPRGWYQCQSCNTVYGPSAVDAKKAAAACCTKCAACGEPSKGERCLRCGAAEGVRTFARQFEHTRAALVANWQLLVRMCPDAAVILRQEAERRGIVHRDVKPISLVKGEA